MFGDSLSVYTKQSRHCFLCQPKCLISILDVDTHIAVLVLIEYDAVLIILYFVFLHCSFAKYTVLSCSGGGVVEYNCLKSEIRKGVTKNLLTISVGQAPVSVYLVSSTPPPVRDKRIPAASAALSLESYLCRPRGMIFCP